ncbi:hypothetical protein OB905_04315 [Halobacteria archaeon AArc-dxtr1]|nr:hypothetical protein [Halobacteria archaeon AArc-dxtr1]
MTSIWTTVVAAITIFPVSVVLLWVVDLPEPVETATLGGVPLLPILAVSLLIVFVLLGR